MMTLVFTAMLAQFRSPVANERVYAAPPNYRFDGNAAEWSVGDDFVIALHASGLVVAGRAPSLSTLHLHLAAPRDFVPPPPGSLGRFGHTIIEDCNKLPESSEEERGKCRAWLERVHEHHAELRALMVRHYVLTPSGVEEISASPAWRRVKALRELPKHLKRHPLQPGPLPRIAISKDSFEVEIPWAALPPMEHTPFTTFRWALSVGDDESEPEWRPAVLMQPRRYRFTECDYNLAAYPGSENDPVWYVPGPNLLLHDVISFRYPRQFFWVPEAISPEIEILSAFEDRLEPGVWLCGPMAAQSWRGQTSIAVPPWLEYRGGFPAPGNYRKQKLPDGSWLVATAPEGGAYGWFGGGQCGACLVWTSHVWRLSARGIEPLASWESGRMDGTGTEHTLDWDIHYGPDLRFVDIYEEMAMPANPGELPTSAGWTRQRHCYSDGRYLPCGAAVRQRPIRRVTKTPEEWQRQFDERP